MKNIHQLAEEAGVLANEIKGFIRDLGAYTMAIEERDQLTHPHPLLKTAELLAEAERALRDVGY